MKVTYETQIVGQCPEDDSTDIYHASFEAEEMVRIEDIQAAIAELPGGAVYQEVLTQDLARSLPNCKVTTVGYHSGVKTTVVVAP